MEIISIIIAILAFVLSLGNAIYTYKCNHKNINLIINSYTRNYIKDKYIYIFDLLIENKSRLPISINSIKIVKGEKEYKININPTLLSEITSRTGKNITGVSKLFSATFPINISGLNDSREFIELSKNIDLSGDCIIKLCTNRGIIKREFNIDSYYFDAKEFFKIYKDYVKRIGNVK